MDHIRLDTFRLGSARFQDDKIRIRDNETGTFAQDASDLFAETLQ